MCGHRLLAAVAARRAALVWGGNSVRTEVWMQELQQSVCVGVVVLLLSRLTVRGVEGR